MKKIHKRIVLCLICCSMGWSLFGIEKIAFELRHRQAVSDPADRIDDLRDLSITGDLQKYGMSAGFGLFYEEPNKFALSHDFQNAAERMLVLDNRVIVEEIGGRVYEAEGLSRMEARILQFVLGFQYLDASTGNMERITEENGVIVARYSTNEGYRVNITFDPETFLMQSFAYTNGVGMSHTYTITEHRKVSGVTFPAVMEESSTNPAVYRLRSILVDQGIDSARFNVPEERYDVTIPENGWSRIPVEIYFGIPFVKGWIGNSPALTFLIDLDLPFSVIDKTIAGQLGLNPEGNISFPTRYPTSGFGVVPAGSFLLREVQFRNKQFLSCDMLPASINIQRPVHGILGSDMFSKVVMKLDLANEVLVLNDPKSFQYQDLGQRHDLKKHPFGLSLLCQLEGTDVNLEIATALGDSLALSDKSYAAGVIAERRRAGMDGYTTGLDFGTNEKIYQLRTVQLGDLEIPMRFAHVVTFPDDHLLAGLDRGWIGNKILSKLDITIDFPKNDIYLKGTAGLDSMDSFNSSGLYVIKSGTEIYVKYVVPDSPAATAGLQGGDVLISLNGVEARVMMFDIVYDNLAIAKGDRLQVVYKRGEEEKTVEIRGDTPFVR